MAGGKVRCGQCFHIFLASPAPTNSRPESVTRPQKETVSVSDSSAEAGKSASRPPEQQSPNLFNAAEDEDPVNPDWLHTLFDDEDLDPVDQEDEKANLNSNARRALALHERDDEEARRQPEPSSFSTQEFEPEPLVESREFDAEPTPWEDEFAELDDPFVLEEPDQTPKRSGYMEYPASHTSRQEPALDETLLRDEQVSISRPMQEQSASQPSSATQPDYMTALESLARSVADHSPSISDTESKLQELAAIDNLSELMYPAEKKQPPKSSLSWLWWSGSLLCILLMAVQVFVYFFETGSRSETFRPLYKVVCGYTGCTLPSYENIAEISIQHIRIQSHPTVPNALLVNAIMTNNSHFSQPMPKIALEFFDLNETPVAARLFSPSSYLHKDFLDITYMPPATPIHLVIPILDPGAAAVSHKLAVYSSSTRSL